MAEDIDNNDRDIFEVTLDMMRIAILSANVKEKFELISWDRVYKANHDGKLLVGMIKEVERGLSESSYDLNKETRLFYQFCHSLHMVDGVLERLVIWGSFEMGSWPGSTPRNRG